MNSSKLRKSCEQSNISEPSIWGIIDLTQSQQEGGKLKQMIGRHNASCPTNTITDKLGRQRTYYQGRIQGNQHTLVQELMYLCLDYMETLRKSDSPIDRMLYKQYLQSDRLPLMTNNLQLMKKLRAKGVHVGITSIYNFLKLLLAAGIILMKRNTRRRVTQRADGTVEHQLCKAGRGDFQLFLNKEIFAFKEPFQVLASAHTPELDKPVEKLLKAVEKPQNRPKPLKNVIIENQSVTSLNRLNLEQLISNKIKTKKYLNNKRGKVHAQESGVSSRLGNDDLEPSGSKLQKLERSSRTPPRAAADSTGNREFGTPAAARNERERRKRAALQQFRELGQQVQQIIPEKRKHFYLKMLQIQYVSRLYPDLDRFYLSCIRTDIQRLFKTYFDTLKAEKDQDIFLRLSRAIEMVQEYRERHPDYKLYDPLSFLRWDYTGGFRDVVEKWLPEEMARLRLRAEKQSKLMIWQKGTAYSEDLFKRVIETLNQGHARSHTVFKEAERELSTYFQKINAPERMQARFRKAFSERFLNFFQELEQEAKEKYDQQQDQPWLDFERYRKLVAEGS